MPFSALSISLFFYSLRSCWRIMKILDWMRRKLHPATNYSRVSHTKAPAFKQDTVHPIDPSIWPPPAFATEPDIETPLLFHVNLTGILTIGTLGYSHLPPHFSEEPKLECPEKEIPAAAKPPSQITHLHPPPTELFMIKPNQSVVKIHVPVPEEKLIAVPLLKEDRERKERKTLADLLAAEPAARSKKVKRKKKGDELESSESRNHAVVGAMHRMMTRMVKKKVHPEAATEGRKAISIADTKGGG